MAEHGKCGRARIRDGIQISIGVGYYKIVQYQILHLIERVDSPKRKLSGFLLVSSCLNNTSNRFIGNIIIPCNFSKRFALFNAMKNGRPPGNGNFLMGVLSWMTLCVRKYIFLLRHGMSVHKDIIPAWEKLL